MSSLLQNIINIYFPFLEVLVSNFDPQFICGRTEMTPTDKSTIDNIHDVFLGFSMLNPETYTFYCLCDG